MSEYLLQEDLFLGVTPAGAYYTVQDKTIEPARAFLQRLMRLPETPAFNADVACEFTGHNQASALEFVHWLQDAGLIFGLERQEEALQERLEDILPGLLAPLSDVGKVVLSESQGLYLGVAGYPHEAAEELAAMSTELTHTYHRHKSLLQGNLRLKERAWGLIDGVGNSEIGFWPMHIGEETFTLIIEGMPQLNQPVLKQLIWALSIRYDSHQF